MKILPSVGSFRGAASHCTTWLAFAGSFLVCAGCFLPRDYSSWSDPGRSAGRYAILPVLPAQVRITLDDEESAGPHEISMGESNVRNHEEVARTINRVLDTVAGGDDNAIQGPSEIESSRDLTREWEKLQVYLQDPGPLDETWKREGLAAISREIGCSRVLRLRPTLSFKPGLSGDRLGSHWAGRIIVELDMLDLKTAQVVERGSGEAEFYGDAGVFVFGGYGGAVAIPYAFGKAFDRAADQAIRKALDDIFAMKSGGGSAR